MRLPVERGEDPGQQAAFAFDLCSAITALASAQAGQRIAADVVGTEQVDARRAFQAVDHRHVQVVIRRQRIGKESDQAEQHHEHQAHRTKFPLLVEDAQDKKEALILMVTLPR